MSALLAHAEVAAPLAAAWSVHALWMRDRWRRARLDPLTGLPARAAFELRVRRMVRKSPTAVLVIDLNGLKPVNDEFGHAAGDAVIRETGVRLAQWAGGADGIAARLGGHADEFAAAIPAPESLPGELTGLDQWLRHPVGFEGAVLMVGASIGAKLSSPTAADPSLLMRRADEAMYTAKEGGGGWVIAHGDQPTHPTVNGRREGRPGTALEVT
ncbi:GGDEF domain-containing protein [Streptomyces sp. NPDC057654]|uniref:GGDEF domain-containing protein n=1 Tax=Streptomyces sp. NPDC057654 TaxID=3346196 RepID=UPI0036A0F6C8